MQIRKGLKFVTLVKPGILNGIEPGVNEPDADNNHKSNRESNLRGCPKKNSLNVHKNTHSFIYPLCFPARWDCQKLHAGSFRFLGDPLVVTGHR